MRRFSNSHAHEAYVPEDEKQEQETQSSHRGGGEGRKHPKEEGRHDKSG